jgi:dihydropteroate synthase
MKTVKPVIMGILNLTEDSFSDGGKYLDPQRALEHARQMISDGATMLDLGAESTRPGARPTDEATELARIIPITKVLRAEYPDLPLSIDTRKSPVAVAAIEAGADIINDISALRYDPQMAELLSGNPDITVILMHMQGEPENMQNNPHYDDLGKDLLDFFSERIAYCNSKGISKIILDPGIGFGKHLSHNLSILRNLDALSRFELPILLGASRKRFIDAVNPSAPDQRLGGSLAAVMAAISSGVSIVRVHDVKASYQFIETYSAIYNEAQWIS